MNKKIIVILLTLLIIVTILTCVNGKERVLRDALSMNMLIERPVIMLTGYWNPTGKMLINFSTDPQLNPNGWEGENWEELGYDIYSYFPDPDNNYMGNFEVDYQDTRNDFWDITNQIHPIAIISFGAGNGPWEIEYNARNLDNWINDYEYPFQPTPCPPDDTVDVGYIRHSSLPVEQIADAVNNQTNIQAWVDWDDNPGKFLCEYIAYLGMWYQNIHSNIDDPYPCLAAGFVHVKSNIAVDKAMEATKITIRETIKILFVNSNPFPPIITGQDKGETNKEYEYKFISIDPEGDDITYCINWGDNTSEVYIGPHPSNEEISTTHTWSEKGNYTIKAKAIDIYGAESNWSILELTIPKAYIYYSSTPIVQKLINIFEKKFLIKKLIKQYHY